MRSRHVTVSVNLDAVRASAERIRQTTGVPLIAVIKADAYGLGAPRVADAIASVADDFAYFSLHEAREVGRPGLVLGPPEGDPAEYLELGLRPSVANIEDVRKFEQVPSAINVDSGMQRFGCPSDRLAELVAIGRPREIMTHAGDAAAAVQFADAARAFGLPLHAASTSLLNRPQAHLNGVRPGLALYRGAVRVSTRLVTVRDTHGPVGYTRFDRSRVGVILAGYSHGLSRAPVMINGRPQRLLEVGMNTSFVSVDPADALGDEVVLLGDGVTELLLAKHFDVREHEILCRYCSMGNREYVTKQATVDQKGGTAVSAVSFE